MTSSRADTPSELWASLQSFVEDNSARAKLRQQLGAALGSGRGKVKVLLLLEKQPLTLAEIADALQVDRPYTTVIVNRLEALGVVTREPDARDRRRKRVALTAAGRAAARAAREVCDTPPVALTRLSPAELRQLGALVAKLTSAEAAAGGPLVPSAGRQR
ncbi:MAG TPA: MarR family transcriptional regulator [Acidothermaceae bacterium]